MNEEFLENWTRQLRKGVLELFVLNLLNGRRLYGYDIVKRLRELNGMVITEGTIYPILSRLKREGLVDTSLEESPEGPARKYYELTRAGQKVLERMGEHWRVIVGGIDAAGKERVR